MEQVFKPYTGPMDFAAILEQAKDQKQLAEKLSERALNGDVGEEEAVELTAQLRKAASSLKATVDVFIEIHKEVSPEERKTLADAIEKLDAMSRKFKSAEKKV